VPEERIAELSRQIVEDRSRSGAFRIDHVGEPADAREEP
jgi:hypothetical protein